MTEKKFIPYNKGKKYDQTLTLGRGKVAKSKENLSRVARSRAITDGEIEHALIAERGFLGLTAARLGISHTTMRKRILQSDHLKNVLYACHERNADEIETSLISRAVNGNDTRAAEIYLNARAKDRGYGKQDGLSINIGNSGSGVSIGGLGVGGESIDPVEAGKILLKEILQDCGLSLCIPDNIQASVKSEIQDAEIVESHTETTGGSGLLPPPPTDQSGSERSERSGQDEPPLETPPLPENRGVTGNGEASPPPMPTQNGDDNKESTLPPPLFSYVGRK